ncbi:MAG: prolyl oligopeptidase family serine peptidase [Thermoanaerobaculia bacterium]
MSSAASVPPPDPEPTGSRGRELSGHRTAPALMLLLALLVTFPMTASPASSPSPTPWTIDDVVRTESSDEWTVSRDGRLAVGLRSSVERVEGKEKRVWNLWLVRLDRERDRDRDRERPAPESGSDEAAGAPGGHRTGPELETLQLTRGRDRVSSPAFSPDGRHVAYLSDRKPPSAGGGDGGDDGRGERQVWVLPLAGGEPYPVTELDRSVRAVGWIDAKTLVVLAPEARSAWELERKAGNDESRVVEDAEHEPPVRLFRVGLDGEVRRITGNDDWIDSLAVAPDGRRAVITAQQSLSFEFDSKVAPHTRLVDLATGASERLFAEPVDGRPLLPRDVRWRRDSGGFYFVDDYSTHPLYRSAAVSRLWHHDLETGTTRRVDLDWDRGLGRGYAVVPDGFVALLADGVHDRLARYRMEGAGGDRTWRRTDLAWGEHADHAGRLDDLAAAPDGSRILYQHSKVDRPPQWYAAGLEGDRLTTVRRFTGLNASFADKPTGRYEVIHFTGARGDEVEGILAYPLDVPEGGTPEEPRPLILDIHGGPASRDRDSWDQRWAAPTLLWRQKGAFTLQVNYHGSAGYGLEWVESIGGGKYYELEIPDLEAAVDHVIERGLADPERLATTGWSNGGILSAELITRTDRYKAASIGAADVEWISDWANVSFGASFDNYYFGATPWEDPELYVEKSPFFRLTEVTTPTIVYTGTEDTNVPPHQSWNLFRALQQIGRTDVRLVIFPGERHGLQEIPHQRRKIEEDLAWLDRHLFGVEEPRPEAVRPGTLLAGLLQRAQAARGPGGALGAQADGLLVPETVSFAGLEVGRFEVTRAQYAAFDPGAFPGGGLAPGEEDLPMTGVPFERAREYAAWLAERTGRPFRLPTDKEAERLAAAARKEARKATAGGPRGNTLDRWAGYAPNPDDEAEIRRALESVAEGRDEGAAGAAPLLLPVGSLPGAGDDPVFDLDGNAAEWAVRSDGTGKPVGPSADRSTDPRSPRSGRGEPAPEYVGFRVVVGEPPPG